MLCLNLGSFVDVIPGEHWRNLDILPLHDQMPEGIRFCRMDLRRGLTPFPDNSITAIRASHVFEHLLIEEQRNLARECYRVLEPGGVLRVMVPDGKKILDRYYINHLEYFDKIQPQEYIQSTTEFEKLSRLLYSGDGAHHCLHDKEFMCDILTNAGFNNIFLCAVNESNSKIIETETKDQHIEISLIMEGVK